MDSINFARLKKQRDLRIILPVFLVSIIACIDRVNIAYAKLTMEQDLTWITPEIFGAGAGMPFFTTDTVAAQRALEIGADALLLAKSGVDGVYSSDPRKDKNATKFDQISYDEVLTKSLAVADAAAFSLCRENKLPIVVFNLLEKGNIARAVRGEAIGTLVN